MSANPPAPAPVWRISLRIAADHPALAGHFPSKPVVPGVLLLDEVLHALAGEASRWRVERVKFHHVVLPEEPLRLEAHRREDGTYAFELRNDEDQRLVVSGLLLPWAGAP